MCLVIIQIERGEGFAKSDFAPFAEFPPRILRTSESRLLQPARRHSTGGFGLFFSNSAGSIGTSNSIVFHVISRFFSPLT
jgi:hypothetical protein